jgi:hypothetical protein
MLKKILLQADPVLTSEDGQLRAEGFSSCCGVYARADLLADAFTGRHALFGTTNVDFGADMRKALLALGNEPAGLVVGADELLLQHHRGEAIERRVALPLRWRKGFGEVQALHAGLARKLELRAAELQRFLRTLPTAGKHGWLVPVGRGARWSQTPMAGAVHIAGLPRLRLLERLSRHATSLVVHGGGDGEVAAFVLHTADARFSLVLSVEVWRGFSGEGRLLHELARGCDPAARQRVGERLAWGLLLAPQDEAERLALARLASEGGCGFDLHEDRWFRRELPFDRQALLAMHPRLGDARELVAAGAVRVLDGQPLRAEVESPAGVHRMARDADGEWSCTCPWFAAHGGERGPCKHVLAALLVVAS